MKFIKIDPKARTVEIVEAPSVADACEKHIAVAHKSDNTGLDHTILGPGFGMFVYEWGLLGDYGQSYFGLKYADGKQNLFAYTAILYFYDGAGNTITIPAKHADQIIATLKNILCFYADADAVESAIQRGEVIRPQTRVNGEVVWEWNR